MQTFDSRTATQLDTALESARRNGAGAVVIFASPLVFFNSSRIANLAREKRLPTVGLFTEFAEAGGLISYGPSLTSANRQAGDYVGKILKGAKPADLPVQRPTKFELVINLKTANALGLTVPQSILVRADAVIE